jgi:hypothetical protein
VKKLAVLLVVLLFTLAAAVPVYAGKPDVETGAFDDDWAFDPPICQGIEVRDNDVGSYRTTFYYDDQGNLLWLENHWSGIDHLYNPANRDVVLTGHYSAHYRYDARTGEETVNGIVFNITVPGYGTVLLEAGRTGPSGRTVGKHSSMDPKDMEQLCSLLVGD